MTDLMRGFRRETLTCVEIAEGDGTEESPVRIVEYWYHDDGTLLLRRDTWDGEPPR